ncbi:uncharacterized protein ARMOST_19828 [Armillaria ostoyae]|uniref:Tf2-1-like SH3-like domain-containing protein n=1 Tax=Armillaria ostoyae TaxID=47428 RepID=A0A284S5M5_ARMOS|nr:uncharacterized protein ARMOST_19828 [Armillaria ostoyae]
MSTTFHLQTDRLTERMNRSIGQIFRAEIHPDQNDWINWVDLTEFTINVSVSQTTRYAPFELNGGYLPSMIREYRLQEGAPPGIHKFAMQALANLAEAHNAIIEARVFQMHYVNKKRSNNPSLSKGDLVYLLTKNLNLPKGRVRKLCLKYIGPYVIEEAYPEMSNYTLQLPVALQEHRIHPTFHISLLWPHHENNNVLFPNRQQPDPYNFGAADGAEWFVDEIVRHRWSHGQKLEYQVCWSQGDTTWEPHENCNKLQALDRYLELMGVKYPRQLSRRIMDAPQAKTKPGGTPLVPKRRGRKK